MMKKMKQYVFTAVIGLFLLNSCSKESVSTSTPSTSNNKSNQNANIGTLAISSGFPETFESGTKTSYTAAVVSLASGNWNFDDALIGNTSSDPKNGTKSVRIRNTGKITMQFNVNTGASSVSIQHAKYGTDGNSTWELWMSINNGTSYTKVGSTITTSATTLQTANFTMSATGNVRFEIRKISGGANRINIDDFVINDNTVIVGIDGDHMAMGNPSGATNVVTNANNYLMQKTQYALSYNRSRATPNWVSWYVGPNWLGSAPRQDDFRADATLPSGWYQVGSTSYSGSGFDRGHNCPSADRTSTIANNSATFLMTNMIPQAPNNNQQTWANLENYTRTLVNSGNEVYVIMGSYGIGGTGTNGTFNTINKGNITVPSNIWKVIVVLSQGTNDVSRVTTTTRVIAVNTPNTNTISSSWGTYRTSVDAIEAATGYNILSNVPTNIQTTIEASVDNGPTN
jgi:endonuclease G